MNRTLGWINLLGVLALAAVCAGQWQVNRHLNLQVTALEKVRLGQTTALEDQQRHLAGAQSDLERFREQLTSATNLAREDKDRLAALERQVPQLTGERDELKAGLTNWSAAVKLRDQRLTEAEAQILRLAEERNAVVTRFNDLAAKYEQAVTEVNAARARAAAPAAEAKP